VTSRNPEWSFARNELAAALADLGFAEELGDQIARHLGSPKAIQRMTAYLLRAKPADVELVVDEMLAIKAEIDAWREKKASEEANAYYNYVLYYGFDDDPDCSPDDDEEAEAEEAAEVETSVTFASN